MVRMPDLWSSGHRFESQQDLKKIYSRFNFLCKLSFWYLFHPCVSTVTAVAHKWFWSLCQKCRWQVTAKHTWCTLHIWLQTKWQCKPMHGCVVYKEHAPTAAVSHGTSHVIVTTKQHCEYATFSGYSKTCCVKLHYATKAQWVCLEAKT